MINRKAQSIVRRYLSPLLDSSWVGLLVGIGKIITKIYKDFTQDGLYEVLDYESTLELHDRLGKSATFKKREKVRYLQDNIIAYQDHAWGDGEILIDYQCKPGIPVDQYRPGQKTYILISLREVKSRGDVDDYNIEWGIRNGFIRNTEQWETEIRHRTKRLKIQVIFPKSRPPKTALLKEPFEDNSPYFSLRYKSSCSTFSTFL